jgi:hypothetical protein
MIKKKSKLSIKMKEYFNQSGLDLKMLAYLCYVTEGHLKNIMYGHRKASRGLKAHIIEKTEGFITMEDFD